MVVLRALALTSIVCWLPGFAYAGPVRPCTTAACGIHHAPSPEIGDGLVGFAVAAVILFACLMLPRVKMLLQAKAS